MLSLVTFLMEVKMFRSRFIVSVSIYNITNASSLMNFFMRNSRLIIMFQIGGQIDGDDVTSYLPLPMKEMFKKFLL